MSPVESNSDVKKEETREEEDSQKGCRQGQVVPQERKGCCGGKACKATRPTPKGNEQ